MADAYASSETITAEATTMRLLRMPRLHNQKLTKPGVHSIARTLLRCTYAKNSAQIVERRKHTDDMKAFALRFAARTVLPVGIVVLRIVLTVHKWRRTQAGTSLANHIPSNQPDGTEGAGSART